MASTLTSAITVLLLTALLLTITQGQQYVGGGCLCRGGSVDRLNPKLIKELQCYNSTLFCSQREIVVTLKNGAGRRCLNPESKFTKRLLENLQNRHKLRGRSTPI